MATSTLSRRSSGYESSKGYGKGDEKGKGRGRFRNDKFDGGVTGYANEIRDIATRMSRALVRLKKLYDSAQAEDLKVVAKSTADVNESVTALMGKWLRNAVDIRSAVMASSNPDEAQQIYKSLGGDGALPALPHKYQAASPGNVVAPVPVSPSAGPLPVGILPATPKVASPVAPAAQPAKAPQPAASQATASQGAQVQLPQIGNFRKTGTSRVQQVTISKKHFDKIMEVATTDTIPEAKRLFQDLQREKLDKSHNIFYGMMKACLENGDLHKAVIWLDSMGPEFKLEPTAESHEILIWLMLAHGEVDVDEIDKRLSVMRQNFRDYKPVLDLYVAIVEKVTAIGNFTWARNCLDNLPQTGLKQTVQCYEPLLRAHAEAGNIEDVQSILDHISDKQKLLLSSLEYHWLVLAHTKSNDLSGAEEYLKTIQSKKLTPHPRSFRALLQGYAQVGDIAKVQEAFTNLCQRRVADAYSNDEKARGESPHDDVIEAYWIMKDAGMVLEWVQKKKKDGYPVTAANQNLSIDTFAEVGNYQQCSKLFTEMKSSGLRMNRATLAVMIKACEISGLDADFAEGVLKNCASSGVFHDPAVESTEEESNIRHEALLGAAEAGKLHSRLEAMFGDRLPKVLDECKALAEKAKKSLPIATPAGSHLLAGFSGFPAVVARKW